MIYFGQEVGEDAEENAGFGTRSRTSIFDYVGVPHHQRWMNEGKFDGGQLSDEEKTVRDFYKRLLNFTLKSVALNGKFKEIQTINRNETKGYDSGIYSFVRYSVSEKLIISVNFSAVKTSNFDLLLPSDVIKFWGLKDGFYTVKDQLYDRTFQLQVSIGIGSIKLKLLPSESFILKI